MRCSIKDCPQQVLLMEERVRFSSMCYFHAKCRDGLFGKPCTYTFVEDEKLLQCSTTNPDDYIPVGGEEWNQ